MSSRRARWLGLALGASLLSMGSADAQPMRRMERDASRADVARSANQLADDIRDLQNFRNTLSAFDAAWQRQDAMGVSGALRSFVQQGRAEVAEQQRETWQAQNEAQRSGWEARRDRNWKDARDARDDRRDAMRERRELMEETAALDHLERAVAATYQWGPSQPVLLDARRAMQRFIHLAQQEVRRSRQELREDRRELREDQRAMRRGYPYPAYGAGQPVPVGAPPPPVVVQPAPPPVVVQPAPPPPRPVYVQPPAPGTVAAPPPRPVYVPPPAPGAVAPAPQGQGAPPPRTGGL